LCWAIKKHKKVFYILLQRKFIDDNINYARYSCFDVVFEFNVYKYRKNFLFAKLFSNHFHWIYSRERTSMSDLILASRLIDDCDDINWISIQRTIELHRFWILVLEWVVGLLFILFQDPSLLCSWNMCYLTKENNIDLAWEMPKKLGFLSMTFIIITAILFPNLSCDFTLMKI
jgi:hypothetical protein